MLSQYSHDLVTSLMLWLDNRLLNQGQAYINVTGTLYRQPNSSIAGITYVSPYRSWVYDSCVAGATIPTGFYNTNGQFLTRQSGIVMDFINGRVISSQDWGATLTGVYARKQVNLYFSSLQQVSYLLEQVFQENPNLSYLETGFMGGGLAAPMIILTNALEYNTPWALGGEQKTENTIRAFVLTDSNYIQEGVNSICTDASYKTIPFCSYSDAPITSSGDIKGGIYNYCTGIFDRIGCQNGVWIDKVYARKVNEDGNRNTTFYLSLVEFELSKPRFTI